MLIWSRWGILGLLIPFVPIIIAHEIVKAQQAEKRKALKSTPASDVKEKPPTPEEAEALNQAQWLLEIDQQIADKRAENLGFAIGSLIGAVVLWPLGRWMNTPGSRTIVDLQTGQLVELPTGGGHTLFFIPMQYWAFIWPLIGLGKFVD